MRSAEMDYVAGGAAQEVLDPARELAGRHGIEADAVNESRSPFALVAATA